MFQQIIILSIIYIIGILFAALFYPVFSFGLIFSSGLFWGGLIYILTGILLSFIGLYTKWIWIGLGIDLFILAFLNFRKIQIWKKINKLSVIKSACIMFGLFAIGYFYFGNDNQLATSSASLPYLIIGSRIYNYSTIFIKGAGYDFRSQYGISEALIHGLGNYFHLPAVNLWHPMLWISQYTFLFYSILGFAEKGNKNKRITIGFLSVIWTATTPMNWMQSFYIHVHLFSSFALLICFYSFWRLMNSPKEEIELALLSSLSLCGYGFSRVEAPIFILIILLIFFVSREYHKAEYRILFFPPIFFNLLWLTFLYFAYRNTSTQYWTDNRLLVAMFSYFLVMVFLTLEDYFKFRINLVWVKKKLYFLIIIIPTILSIFNYKRFFQTIESVFSNMFGPFTNLGFGSWDFYWVEVLVLAVILLLEKQINKRRKKTDNVKLLFFAEVLLAYLTLIIILGFFRMVPYTGIRWGDSASRMLSHISPTIGLVFGLFMVEKVITITKLSKKSKD